MMLFEAREKKPPPSTPNPETSSTTDGASITFSAQIIRTQPAAAPIRSQAYREDTLPGNLVRTRHTTTPPTINGRAVTRKIRIKQRAFRREGLSETRIWIDIIKDTSVRIPNAAEK